MTRSGKHNFYSNDYFVIEIIKILSLKWVKTTVISSPWLERYWDLMSLKWFKTLMWSIHHGWENFWIMSLEWLKPHCKQSTMVGEMFGFYVTRLAKNTVIIVPWLEKFFWILGHYQWWQLGVCIWSVFWENVCTSRSYKYKKKCHNLPV